MSTTNGANGRLTITRLEIRNFQRVRAGTWDLTAGLQRLTSGGKNRQGKTSVLRAIRILFEGAGAVPKVPVNTDADLSEDEAYVRAALSNGWTVARTFTEKGSYLHVVGPDGGKHGQSVVDTWTNRDTRDTKNSGAFDPLTFFLLKPEQQAEVLLGLASDPDLKEKLDQNAVREKELYEARTPLISEKRRLSQAPRPEGERPDPIDVSAEMAKMGALQKQEREKQDAERELRTTTDQIAQVEARVTDITEQIQKLEAERDRLAERREKMVAHADEVKATLDDLPDVSGEMEEVRARIDRADRIQTALEPWKEYERAQARLEEVSAEEARLTSEITDVRNARTEMIASAEFPIDGLDFTAEGAVQLNGLPLDQASGRERVELAIAAAVAACPNLGVILVDEGNDLDAEALERIDELAQEHGLQPIVARLGLEGAGELEVVDGWGPAPEEAPDEPDDTPEPVTADAGQESLL